MPSIDPTTGTFSKKMPAPNGWSLALAAFVQQVIAAPGAISVKLDSLVLGRRMKMPVPARRRRGPRTLLDHRDDGDAAIQRAADPDRPGGG